MSPDALKRGQRAAAAQSPFSGTIKIIVGEVETEVLASRVVKLSGMDPKLEDGGVDREERVQISVPKSELETPPAPREALVEALGRKWTVDLVEGDEPFEEEWIIQGEVVA